MNGKYNLYLIFFIISTFKFAYGGNIKCNKTISCPESAPCCSQFGVCGKGNTCVVGCDIRFSYNLSACMPVPRMSDFSFDFTKTDNILKEAEYLGNYSSTDWLYSGYIGSHKGTLLLQMPKNAAATVVSSTKYLWYGRVSAALKTSHLQGVITAFILFSDVQDEVDFEFVGDNLTQIQTNYYSQGHENYTHSTNYSASNTFKNYHIYEMDWQEDQIDWYLDGVKFRTLYKKDTWNETSKHFAYPQTPARVQISLWPGGDKSNAPGTIQWAGGPIDWDSEDIKKFGYYYAYIKNITVKTHNLPKGVKLEGSDKESDLHAFLYNSTNGNVEDVFLTNRSTWLGSNDATGFNPKNEIKKKKVTTKSSSSSKTQSKSDDKKTTSTKDDKSTKSDTSTTTKNDDDSTQSDTATATETETATDDNSQSTATGFVQKSNDKKSPETKSSSSSSCNVNIILTLVATIISSTIFLF